MSTSCLSSKIVKEPNSNKYRLLGCFQATQKLNHRTKVFTLSSDNEVDAVLSLKAANQVKLIGSTLLIYPTFWDSSSELESKLIYRDRNVSFFEVKQKSNNRVGYTITVNDRRDCCED